MATTGQEKQNLAAAMRREVDRLKNFTAIVDQLHELGSLETAISTALLLQL